MPRAVLRRDSEPLQTWADSATWISGVSTSEESGRAQGTLVAMSTRHVPSGRIPDVPATLGVDLASKPKNTAVCIIDWTEPRASIRCLEMDVTDERILELAREPATVKVGIDAPFGWPEDFVNAVTRYASSGRWPSTDVKRLTSRETDRHVREVTRRWPLSVSSSWLAYLAIRCANLLTELAQGKRVDRIGGGLALEVYPRAALFQWGLTTTGYKRGPGARQVRVEIVRELREATWLSIASAQARQLEESDHLLDALIAALVARAAALGHTAPPQSKLLRAARLEGWIHLPHTEPIASFQPWQSPSRRGVLPARTCGRTFGVLRFLGVRDDEQRSQS